MASVLQLFGLAVENDPVLVRILTVGYNVMPHDEREAVEAKVAQAQVLARAAAWDWAFQSGAVTYETPSTPNDLFDTVQIRFHNGRTIDE